MFLKNGILPEDKTEVEKVRRKALRFWLSKDQKLYKRSYSGPYLLCIHPEVVEILLKELHKEICGSHTGGRSLAHSALTQGYWWPSMQKSMARFSMMHQQTNKERNYGRSKIEAAGKRAGDILCYLRMH